jgi:cell division protein FtsB
MEDLFYRKARKQFAPRELLRRAVRNKRLTAVVIVGAVILGFALFGKQGVRARFQLEQEKTSLEMEIRQAETEYKVLQQRSRDLDSNYKEIERAAREKYGLSRSGETVYRTAPAR